MNDGWLAIKFHDEPKVIHLVPFTHQGAPVIDLKLTFSHPRKLNTQTEVIYRKTSTLGKRIYYYSEGTRAGEVRGG